MQKDKKKLFKLLCKFCMKSKKFVLKCANNFEHIMQNYARCIKPQGQRYDTAIFIVGVYVSLGMCGWCCTLCLMCQVTSNMEENCCVTLCTCCPIMALRIKWRAEHNIEVSVLLGLVGWLVGWLVSWLVS